MKRLLTSSKAVMAILALTTTALLVYTGKLDSSYYLWLVGALVLGYQTTTALEDRVSSKKESGGAPPTITFEPADDDEEV